MDRIISILGIFSIIMFFIGLGKLNYNKLNKVKGTLTLNPEENFTQASINVEKAGTKKVKKSTDANKGDIVSQIKGLKELLDAGAITQDEFDKAKKKLLN